MKPFITRSVLVEITSLTSNGYAFGRRVDNGDTVFINQVAASKADAQTWSLALCDLCDGDPNGSTKWRAVYAEPAKQRMLPLPPEAESDEIDDRILSAIRVAGRPMSVPAITRFVFGNLGMCRRVNERVDHLHETDQLLQAIVFRASTGDGDEIEVFGTPEVFGGVMV